MNKTYILSILLIICCFSPSYGQGHKNKYVLLDYDKAYFVDISVDTTLRLNQLPEYKNKKDAQFTTPHKVHCDFKLLYLWKDNYAVRFLVTNMKKIDASTINFKKIKQRFFDANAFDEEYYNRRYVPRLNILCTFEEDSLNTPYFEGQHLIEYNNSVYTLEPKYMCVIKYFSLDLWLKTSIYKSIPMFYGCELKDNPEQFIFENDKLKSFMCESLFSKSQFSYLFIPEPLPLHFTKIKRNLYNWGKEGTNVSAMPVLRVGQKAIYKILNHHMFGEFDRKSRKLELKHLGQVQILYIPHVLFLPYFTTSFKYKINAINGQALNRFMIGYEDNFKPKMHVSHQRNEVKAVKENTDEVHKTVPVPQIIYDDTVIKVKKTDDKQP